MKVCTNAMAELNYAGSSNTTHMVHRDLWRRISLGINEGSLGILRGVHLLHAWFLLDVRFEHCAFLASQGSSANDVVMRFNSFPVYMIARLDVAAFREQYHNAENELVYGST